jgi:hypothetical protein
MVEVHEEMAVILFFFLVFHLRKASMSNSGVILPH